MAKTSKTLKENQPHYLGHRQRLKDRFILALQSGNTSSIPDYEILEIVLFSAFQRRDVKPLAKKLLNKYGGFSGLISCDVNELLNDEDLNISAICQLKAINESSLRNLKEKAEEKPVIQSWKALLDYCRSAMGNSKKEEFRILFLNQKHRLIADEVQQRGTIDQTPVYPREVVKRALELGAASLILCHNHPSGDPSPSKADIEITEQIENALNSIEIKLHDHLIIAKNRHYSFAENGLI
jgi:DNA repair protein RadC